MVQSHIAGGAEHYRDGAAAHHRARTVRDSKLDVLRSIRRFSARRYREIGVRGQYGAGLIAGAAVPAYRQEENVAPDSNTETFVAMRCCIDNWRWAGVPFYIRTGKRMPKRASEIAIYFKAVPRILFNSNPRAPLAPNMLSIRIQPDEGLGLNIISKMPGADLRLAAGRVDFHYTTTSPEAYETSCATSFTAIPDLFMRRDAVEASWRLFDPIIAVGRIARHPPFRTRRAVGTVEVRP